MTSTSDAQGGTKVVGKALEKVPGIMVNAFTDVMDKLGIGEEEDGKRPSAKKAGPVVVVYKKKKKGGGGDDDDDEKSTAKGSKKTKKSGRALFDARQRDDRDDDKKKSKSEAKKKKSDEKTEKSRKSAKTGKGSKKKGGGATSDTKGKPTSTAASTTGATTTKTGYSTTAATTKGVTELSNLAPESTTKPTDAATAAATRPGSKTENAISEGHKTLENKASEYPAEVYRKAADSRPKSTPTPPATTSPALSKDLLRKTAAYKVIKEIQPYIPDTPSNRARLARGEAGRPSTTKTTAAEAPLPGKHKLDAGASAPAFGRQKEKKIAVKAAPLKKEPLGGKQKSAVTPAVGTPKTDNNKIASTAADMATKETKRLAGTVSKEGGVESSAAAPAVAPGSPTSKEAQFETHDAKQASRHRKMLLAAGLCCVALIALAMIVAMAVMYVGAGGAAANLTDTTTPFSDTSPGDMTNLTDVSDSPPEEEE
uniref:Uncharacterized protein n=1 Tax=Romanomermis culicivorax TaxID=13658 RepID=A0A915L4M8_ROMCU